MAPRDPKVDMILRVPLFSGFSQREAAALARQLEDVDVREGKVLTREGTLGSEFFILVEGRVAVDRDGRRIAEMGPGDFLGEVALVLGGTRTATTTALVPSRVLVLTRRAFRGMLEQHARVESKVLRALAERVQKVDPDAT
jgi:CRP/FNR family transcriptional regulator, cyclic AMP receptor protein